jgi:hypothetical protein
MQESFSICSVSRCLERNFFVMILLSIMQLTHRGADKSLAL